MKYKHQRRWRAAYLALAAAGALLCGTAAQAVDLTCGTNGPNGAKVEFLTGNGEWQVYGAHTGGAWQAAKVVSSGQQDAGILQTQTWLDHGANWLTPGSTSPGIDTSKAHFFRVPVVLDARIDPASVKIGESEISADDRINSVTVTDKDKVPTDAEIGLSDGKGASGHGEPGKLKVPKKLDDTSVAVTANWVAGVPNYMIWKVTNDQNFHQVLSGNKWDGNHGPMGMYANVKITATSKALPGTAAPVPVNNPWALGLLGVAVAGAAAHARRRKR